MIKVNVHAKTRKLSRVWTISNSFKNRRADGTKIEPSKKQTRLLGDTIRSTSCAQRYSDGTKRVHPF